ncbi:hypothetical protein HYALB_00004496 [Hymenoscyphus albidus]|uniref:Uncharacterized protein n=1 Tax=Hymenoscyphus albidus TaxID=595503 RepID=A0A9N9QC97_9HELO|nr:hypothetical protein HYALB_00004496 [Hymenoscyphus albidus]
MHLLTTLTTLLLTTPLHATPLSLTPRKSHPVPLQKPFCKPATPGICTLAVSWPAATPKLHTLELYNSHCRLIGNNNTIPALTENFNLYSELPYVVVATTHWPSFKYKGDRYNEETTGLKGMKHACEMGAGAKGVEGVVYMCEFDCEVGVWDEVREVVPGNATEPSGTVG